MPESQYCPTYTCGNCGERYPAFRTCPRCTPAAPAEPLTDLQEAGALHCATCGRRFYCNICPDCAGQSRDERAESYKTENKQLRAQLTAQQAPIRNAIVTTLIDSEYEAARKWRDAWVDAEEDAKPQPLDEQIVAYLVADSEQLRKLARLLGVEPGD